MKSILEGISGDASQYKHMVPATKDAHYDFLVRCLQETHRHIEALWKTDKLCSSSLDTAGKFLEKLQATILEQKKP